ncbi:M20/M25/M40 family metallo-hydrolase [Streptomyces sp. HSW2009]|uniref:M20/M25/M40 family metallo-hydrolase n=1 Tax=Streptomyces sp. HSW2009 TaxID=3142890 RepID=UPI0032EE3DDE
MTFEQLVTSGDGMDVSSRGADVEGELSALRADAKRDLAALVSIPSVFSDAQHPEHVQKAARTCADLLSAAGMDVEVITPPQSPPVDGEGRRDPAPIVYASYLCGDLTAPTVLLYAHYDVVPATWQGAFTPEVVGGRMTERGAADDKSGVVMHLTTCRYLQKLRGRGSLRVNVRLVLEGEEESGTDTLATYMEMFPERFRADVVSLADGGNIALGAPTLTTSLRGFVMADVTVRALEGDVHNGMYGGPVPDAYLALIRLLATLHDDKGDVAVVGLRRPPWTGYTPTADSLRKDARVRDGVPLIGTHPLGELLYTGPAVNVVGLERLVEQDARSGAEPLPVTGEFRNALLAGVRARLCLRIGPSDDPGHAFDCLKEHLLREDLRPWGITPEVSYVFGEPGFQRELTSGDAAGEMAESALRTAFRTEKVYWAGQGASIPLTHTLRKINEKADILVWGCQEPLSHIHADHESVDLTELHAMTYAQVLLILGLAGQN